MNVFFDTLFSQRIDVSKDDNAYYTAFSCFSYKIIARCVTGESSSQPQA